MVGDGRLMPSPDYSTRLINAENGNMRINKSWILGRLFRDFETPLPNDIGVSITVFEDVSSDDNVGVPTTDWCWMSGLTVIVIQLGIAAIPCALHGDWGILLVTSAGITLALATGFLPQWKFEKWPARRKSKKVVSLTGGNGTRHVMVIIGNEKGLDLEDLAAAENPRMRRRGDQARQLPITFRVTCVACFAHTFLWLAFLITVTSLKRNTWYLLAVGGVGMIQNVVAAGAKRDVSTSGIHLKEINKIEQKKVMDALMDLEIAHRTVGKSLVPAFFPSLRPAETKWWDGDKDEYEKSRREKRPDSFLVLSNNSHLIRMD